MGKDFKAGLMAGVVLAGVALIWVATRPSLGPQARVPRSAAGANPPSPQARDNTHAAQTDPLASLVLSSPPAPGVNEVALRPDPARAPLSPNQPAAVDSQTSRVALPSGSPQAAAPDLTIYETSEPIKTTRFHIVRRGETLSAIAQQYYGSSDKWRKILTANQKAVKDANKIAPGTKLIIPE